jgi:hypothetical protein
MRKGSAARADFLFFVAIAVHRHGRSTGTGSGRDVLPPASLPLERLGLVERNR